MINRVKPKVLNGKKLNGPMLATLAASYVESINKGAVPNIESAWQYICKSECGKAVEESIKMFEENLTEFVDVRIPMDEDELKAQFDEAKKESLQAFTKRAVGGVSEEYVRELKGKMKLIYEQIKEKNERECYNACQMFLGEAYSFIERKLKNKEFSGGFTEYEQDMNSFQQYFLDNGPQGPNRRVITLEFVQRAMIDAAEYFSKSVTQPERRPKPVLTYYTQL